MFAGLPSLEELKVNMDGEITSVEDAVFAQLPKLKILAISPSASKLMDKGSFVGRFPR